MMPLTVYQSVFMYMSIMPDWKSTTMKGKVWIRARMSVMSAHPTCSASNSSDSALFRMWAEIFTHGPAHPAVIHLQLFMRHTRQTRDQVPFGSEQDLER